MKKIDLFSVSKEVVKISNEIYGEGFVPLHRPIFGGNEKEYLIDCIDSNFVSSAGKKVSEFEKKVSDFTGIKHAIATVNGTTALQVAIELSGVKPEDEVITQALTFVATPNAISHSGAKPIFVDVDLDTMGMSPKALRNFLEEFGKRQKNGLFNKKTGKRIAACVPMHTFGFPCRIKEISSICKKWGIPLIEDSAESLGSFVDNKHTGKFSKISSISFNGNKVITCGGGGMLLTDDFQLAKSARHITTTAKLSHPYDFIHDKIGYNFRLPNLNAALGCAQMEKIDEFLLLKEKVSIIWEEFFLSKDIKFFKPIKKNKANHWLNTIILNSKEERDQFIQFTNQEDVMTRPVWKLMSKLSMYKKCQRDNLINSLWLRDRVVNLPSSVPHGKNLKVFEKYL